MLKTYVLLKHTKSTANVYLQINANQRMRLENRPVDHAFNQITFMDRDGKNRTIRLKLTCDEIFQDKQIKEHAIPANEKWTEDERDAVKFRDGVLTTDNPTVQLFLETSPQFDKFWVPDKAGKVGRCASITKPLYTLYDEEIELTEEDNQFTKRLQAANKIAAIKDVKEGQALMIRLNGSFFKAPDNMKKIRSELIRYLDDANEEMLDKLLKEDLNIDEQTTILIGRAINNGVISFDKVKDQVVLLKENGKHKKLKEISSEYDPEDRKKYFAEFLTSPDGKLLMNDIVKAVEESEKVEA